MTTTGDLRAAGVSIWLDDLSRERIRSGGLGRLISERDVVGHHHQPDDLRERDLHRGGLSDPAGRDPPIRREPDRHRVLAHHRRCAGRVRHPLARVRRDRRRGRTGLGRGESCRRARRGSDPGRGAPAHTSGRPPEPVRQDPGDARGPHRHRRCHRRRDQHQRDAHLRPRPLPPGDRRLPDRAGARPRRGPPARRDPVGRLVLRLARRRRGRSTTGGRRSCRLRSSRVGRRSRTRASRTRSSRRRWTASVGVHSSEPARIRSARSGRRPASRAPRCATRSTSRSSSPREP